jgi:hypothetical protein
LAGGALEFFKRLEEFKPLCRKVLRNVSHDSGIAQLRKVLLHIIYGKGLGDCSILLQGFKDLVVCESNIGVVVFLKNYFSNLQWNGF